VLNGAPQVEEVGEYQVDIKVEINRVGKEGQSFMLKVVEKLAAAGQKLY
jgi:hypothetical protein